MKHDKTKKERPRIGQLWLSKSEYCKSKHWIIVMSYCDNPDFVKVFYNNDRGGPLLARYVHDVEILWMLQGRYELVCDVS